MTIRDFQNNVIANADVKLDFSRCTDGALCQDAIAGAGTVVCGGGNKEVHYTTNLAGQVTVTVQGGTNLAVTLPSCTAATCSPPGATTCVDIFANGTPMGSFKARYINLAYVDGSGLNSGDLSKIVAEAAIAAVRDRCDLNEDGAPTGSLDINKMLFLLNLRGSPNPSVTGCSNTIPCR